MPDIFRPRQGYKPFEYPDASRFIDAINHSYWLVSEWNFLADVDDFKVSLSDNEREIISRTLLAISQVEVAVKRFWGKIGESFPKPEFELVGATFAESEVRHSEAYSHLLHVLGLNDRFDKLQDVPALSRRIDYLSDSRRDVTDHRSALMNLALFSMFIENVSLFSQFAIIKSFNEHRNLLKDIDNIIQATMKEELVHGMFGTWLINQAKTEYPGLVDQAFYDEIALASVRSFHAEQGIISWIFEYGELDFLPKDSVVEFIKLRYNEGFSSIGMTSGHFDVDRNKLSPLQGFIDEIWADTSTDFFHKRPVTYAKMSQSIGAGDLF